MRTPSSFSVFAPVLMELVAPRRSTVYPLWAAALGLSFIALIAACFQSAYRLLFSLSLSLLVLLTSSAQLQAIFTSARRRTRGTTRTRCVVTLLSLAAPP